MPHEASGVTREMIDDLESGERRFVQNPTCRTASLGVSRIRG
jgi:hypothetical protein